MSDQHHIFVLHGDDEAAIEAKCASLALQEASTGMGDFNFLQLDGKSVSDESFANAVYSAPFLTPTKTILLKNPLAMAGGKTGNQKFLKMLESVPESTHLYLLIPDSFEKKDWVTLSKTSFLRKWVDTNKGKSQLIEMKLPPINMMRDWVMRKAVEMKGQIDGAAAQLLVSLIGNDTRAASNELEKLLLYVDRKRPADSDDVRELVSGSVSVSIFDMIDAMAVGNAKDALRMVHLLLEDQEIPQVFAMIVRQFRLLIQAREILDEGGNAQIIERDMDQVPFVAQKLMKQASLFTFPMLREIYAMLVEMDHSFKTSQQSPITALDSLIVKVSQFAKRR